MASRCASIFATRTSVNVLLSGRRLMHFCVAQLRRSTSFHYPPIIVGQPGPGTVGAPWMLMSPNRAPSGLRDS